MLINYRIWLTAALTVWVAGCEPTSIRVTTTSDGGAGSLRAAIDAANRSAGAVQIQLPPGTYELTRCGADDTNLYGDLDITTHASVTIAGASDGPVIIRQTCSDERVLQNNGNGLLTLSGVTVTGGRATRSGSDKGGAVYAVGHVTLKRAKIDGNVAWQSGGGIFARGNVQLFESEVTNNTVVKIDILPTGDALSWPVNGGGISSGSVEAADSTIAFNALGSCTQEALHPIWAAANGPSYGAGITAITTLTLTNTTLSANHGPDKCPGATLFKTSDATGVSIHAHTVTLRHTTIADYRGGAALRVQKLVSTASTVHTRVAGLTACDSNPTAAGSSYNWFADETCNLDGVENRQEPAPFLLGELANNGGSVRTRVPHPASALVNRVPIEACSIAADARGVLRPQGSSCDIGAVEVELPAG